MIIKKTNKRLITFINDSERFFLEDMNDAMNYYMKSNLCDEMYKLNKLSFKFSSVFVYCL